MSVEKRRNILINIFFVATILALVFFGIKFILPLIIPVIIGFIVAIILQKPVGYLTEKTKGGRSVWATVCVILLLLITIVLVIALGFYLYNQLLAFASLLQNYITPITDSVKELSSKFSLLKNNLPDDISKAIENLPGNVASGFAGTIISGVTSFTVDFAAGLPQFLITFIFSILAGVFITSDYNRITRFILRQFNQKNREIIIHTKTLFVNSILKLGLGYLILMGITVIEMLIALSLLGVDYFVVIALFVAIVDILPVLGTGTVLIPWGMVCIIMGKYKFGIGILAIYIIITVIRNLIEPKIIGKQVGLPPLVTLTAMYVGMKLFGIIGMFLLPVLTIIIVKLQEADMIHLWKK